MTAPTRIVITGVTSGIGEELAKQYAAAGVVLGLTGRRADRLEAVAAACRERGATVHAYAVDVVNRPAMKELAADFLQKAGGIDLVIANAGLGSPDKFDRGDVDAAAALFEVNVTGVATTLAPFIPAMLEQRRGHLVAVASIAGFRALPKSVAYSASKAAVQVLMDGLDLDYGHRGISVTTINPGFVESEMTAKNRFKMPFILTTPEAVVKVRRAIARRKKVYTFPWPMALLGRYVLPWAPRWLLRRLR